MILNQFNTRFLNHSSSVVWFQLALLWCYFLSQPSITLFFSNLLIPDIIVVVFQCCESPIPGQIQGAEVWHPRIRTGWNERRKKSRPTRRRNLFHHSGILASLHLQSGRWCQTGMYVHVGGFAVFGLVDWVLSFCKQQVSYPSICPVSMAWASYCSF